MTIKKKLWAAIAVAATVGVLAGCSSDADVVARNISKSAEMFEVDRRIVFINGITDEYLLTIEGRCSVETANGSLGGSLEVTCKLGPDEYTKHFLGLSDNVTFLVEQLGTSDVNEYNYRVIFKPESLIPAIDPQISGLDADD